MNETLYAINSNIFIPFFENLELYRLLVINIPRLNYLYENDNDDDDDHYEDTNMNIKLNVEGCKTYAQILAVTALVMELVVTGRTISLRDVYYALKGLFRMQSECNACILKVGRILQKKRFEMHIIPASKGLVSGSMKFRFLKQIATTSNIERGNNRIINNNAEVSQWYNCSSNLIEIPNYQNRRLVHPNHMESTPTTAAADSYVIISSQWMSTPIDDIEIQWLDKEGEVMENAPEWIVVIEKEGVFHRLVEDRFTERVSCILVTGCGYPDVVTRALVHKINTKYPSMQSIGVCDYNPYGLALLLTYRFPSIAANFECQDIQVNLKWLGIRGLHLLELEEKSRALNTSTSSNNNSSSNNNNSSSSSSSSSINNNNLDLQSSFRKEQLQTLTKNDVKKIQAMINTTILKSLPEYVQELERMIYGGYKCEIESTYSFGIDFLANFLERCLNNHDYI